MKFFAKVKLIIVLKEHGYKILGNKRILPDPIIAINEKWMDSADHCDREQILESTIRYCKRKLKEYELDE